MKTVKLVGVLTICAILVSCAGMTFQKTLADKDRIFTRIIVHDLTKEKSFERIDAWVAKNYKNAQKVIQLREKEDGAIVLKPVVSWVFGMTQPCRSTYTVSIKTKDNRTKLTCELGYTTGTCAGPYPTVPAMPTIKAEFQSVFSGIKKSLTAKSTALDDDF